MAYEVMRELVTTEEAAGAIRGLAVVLPPVGMAVGAVAGRWRRKVRQGLIIGLLAGLTGPAIWVLWGMYNAIMGRFGLDSVAGLLINVGLFSAIGIAIGVAIRLALRRESRIESRESEAESARGGGGDGSRKCGSDGATIRDGGNAPCQPPRSQRARRHE